MSLIAPHPPELRRPVSPPPRLRLSTTPRQPSDAAPRRPSPHTGTHNVPHPYLLTTSVYERDRAVIWPPHAHPEHELLWTDRGVMTMHVAGRQWTITPGIGLWIPAGMEHEGFTRDSTAARATYFAPATWERPWDTPSTVRVPAAVRELLIHLNNARMIPEQRIRAQRVCMDMLERTTTTQFDVPLPADRRIARLVELVLRDPADDRSLEQWASLLNMTARTLTRIFTAEVALSFAQWRRLVRMRAAIGELADGASVKSVAHRVGYSTTSAFVTAFRKTVGCTPGELAGRL